jgi:predicted DNA-binding transcriptional regulator YafY
MTHRGDLTARMVELPLLLTERAYSQRELIERLSVDRKTVKRTIDALSLHYPILEEKQGREVFYRFSDDYQFKPPTLTPREVATLLLAQEAIAATAATPSRFPFDAQARTLLMKIRNSLPAMLREKLDALSTVYGSATFPTKDFTPYVKTIDLLTDAAIRQRQVQLKYASLTDGKTKKRIVEPYCVYFDPDGATLKLIGYDYRRKNIIPFSIDHIREIKVTDKQFNKPENFDLRSYLSENCFNGIHGEPVTVRLRAHGQTARIFAERQFHQSQKLIATTPPNSPLGETTTIEMCVASGRGLVRFILSWMPEIEVLDPPHLQEEVKSCLEQSLNRLNSALE